ncbi:hypothetical protein Acr_20g0008240 [Actinidia rufa]|uniref:Secreted protein n=1 Tax=Actinidia rufa TaxID=165716 RepID=A0A7J0GDV4_9ERIC|nr:hypothetical protein Acr_20g0008140 [Actinidia rufa]GFZ09016.1 hypothetical protein Acr_20g0008240 [Actinidia rufa]
MLSVVAGFCMGAVAGDSLAVAVAVAVTCRDCWHQCDVAVDVTGLCASLQDMLDVAFEFVFAPFRTCCYRASRQTSELSVVVDGIQLHHPWQCCCVYLAFVRGVAGICSLIVEVDYLVCKL